MIIDRFPDYDLEDVLVVEEPRQLRALGDEARARIVALLRERAASVSELAAALGLAKGTVGHHVKVLEAAGLVRVVRTRRVRAVTERYYGRVARLFVLRGDGGLPPDLRGGRLGALLLRQAADELLASGQGELASALVHVRLQPRDARRFERRLRKLVADLQAAESASGEPHALALALFRAATALAPPEHASGDA
ncbi:MAG TPA: winged helix-turn-helix domain-containing protein [Gaiellaceae bacterium]|nr:winged helix-turn-helix domain-containing protein [Gaiellaceae bacterium]